MCAGLIGTTWPVTSQSNRVPQRREPLLDAWRGKLARGGLNPSGDVRRLDRGDRRQADARAPGQEFLRGAIVGPPSVRVPDVGREEFEEADRGALAGGGNQRRHHGERDFA